MHSPRPASFSHHVRVAGSITANSFVVTELYFFWSHYVSMVQTEARSGAIPWHDYPHLFLGILLCVGGSGDHREPPTRAFLPNLSSLKGPFHLNMYQGVLMSSSFQANPRVFIYCVLWKDFCLSFCSNKIAWKKSRSWTCPFWAWIPALPLSSHNFDSLHIGERVCGFVPGRREFMS